MKTLLLYGALRTLDEFVFSMARDNLVEIIDYKTLFTEPDIIEKLITDDTVRVVTFNNVGTNCELWKKYDVELFNILVDHPVNYLDAICKFYYQNYHVVCIDRGHEAFLKQIFPDIKNSILFLPHGGTKLERACADKEIDILYVGSLRREDNILFTPVGIDSVDDEEFYDFIISYYDVNLYPEPQEALWMFCNSNGIELSKQQYADITFKILRSVDDYFTRIRRIELIKRLSHSGMNILICGSDEWQRAIEKDIFNQITYKGVVKPEECIELIAKSRIVINDLPNFGYGAHERIFNGMLNGTVVVSNKSRYLEQRFVHGEDIIFWDGKDYETVVSDIKNIINDSSLYENIVNNAYDKSMHDTWTDRLRYLCNL